MNLSCPKNTVNYCKKIGLSTPLSQAEQVHSNRIKQALPGEIIQGADGLFTFEAIPLSVRTADCVPIVLSERESGFMAVIHCGRKSLVRKIISNSLKKILKNRSVNSEKIKIFIGPHIRSSDYFLRRSEDITEVKKSGFGEFIKLNNGKNYFNLTSAVISELVKVGIRENNIIDSKINTYADKRFFSYRRDTEKSPRVFITICIKNAK